MNYIYFRQLGLDDFEENGNRIILSEESGHLLISKILDNLNCEINFKDSNMSYSDIILYQGRQMAKFLTHEDSYEGFYLRW